MTTLVSPTHAGLLHFEPESGQVTTGSMLLPPDAICWTCRGRSRFRLHRIYAAAYEYLDGRPGTITSCRTLGLVVVAGQSRASDDFHSLEALGLARVVPGVPGRDGEQEPSLFSLVVPPAPPLCIPGHSRVRGIDVSPEPGGEEQQFIDNTLGKAIPSPGGKTRMHRDTAPGQQRWAEGHYGALGWALACASEQLGHPWLRPKVLADRICVSNAQVWRILKKMAKQGDASHDTDKGYMLTGTNCLLPISTDPEGALVGLHVEGPLEEGADLRVLLHPGQQSLGFGSDSLSGTVEREVGPGRLHDLGDMPHEWRQPGRRGRRLLAGGWRGCCEGLCAHVRGAGRAGALRHHESGLVGSHGLVEGVGALRHLHRGHAGHQVQPANPLAVLGGDVQAVLAVPGPSVHGEPA